jgi:hypothetical protein
MILTHRSGALRARPGSPTHTSPTTSTGAAADARRTPLGRYGDGWVLVTAVTATVGVWIAVRTWPVVALLGAFACAALVGGSLAEAVRRRGRTRRRVALDGGLAGVAAVGAAGLLSLFGAWALLVIAVLAAACPAPWVRATAGRRKWSPAPEPVLGRGVPERPPETCLTAASTTLDEDPEPTPRIPTEPWLLDDHALCAAWRTSYLLLEHPHSPAKHLWVAQQRQLYLDEFERRHPTGLCAWLASGARAASDPSPFIVPRRR